MALSELTEFGLERSELYTERSPFFYQIVILFGMGALE